MELAATMTSWAMTNKGTWSHPKDWWDLLTTRAEDGHIGVPHLVKMRPNPSGQKNHLVRLSVVLDEELAEYVRVRAFETRKSRSAYVRDLVHADASRRTSSGPRPAEAGA